MSFSRIGYEQYFKENPYFSNTVLKKEYKYIPPPAAADDTPDEDGVTESMIDFSWERDIEIQVGPIETVPSEGLLIRHTVSRARLTGKMIPKTSRSSTPATVMIARLAVSSSILSSPTILMM